MNDSSLLGRALKPLVRRLPSRSGNAVLAVDVTTRAVKALHVRREDAGLAVVNYHLAHLSAHPSDEEVATACRQALALRLQSEPVALCMSSPHVAIRRVELPAMNPEELREALPWEARRHIENLAEDALLDAQVLSAGGNGGPMEILLVAYPREHYLRVERMWKELGVDLAFVDVGQLATLNSFLPGDSNAGRQPTGVLDLGADEASLAIFSSSDLILFRDLSPRVQHLDTLLAQALGLRPADLENFKRTDSLAIGPVPSAKVEEALGELVAELADDIRSALVYFENRTGGSLDRIHLTGANGAFLDRQGLAESLSALGGASVERHDPFRGFRLGLIDRRGLIAVSSELCSAAGVAVRFLRAT